MSETVAVLSGSIASESKATAPPRRRLQLDYIDGMRALAALYIVAHHAVRLNLPPLGPVGLWGRFLAHGQEVVAVFLVISGFCLALPQAQRHEWTVDASAFLKRRARRILPPYYAAVIVAIVINAIQSTLAMPFTVRSVWIHLLMLQNWSIQDMYTLDGTLWSVALECQIYLLFPLVILCRRKLGPFITLALLVGAGLLGMRVLGGRGQVVFLAYFGLGVFFSEVAFRPSWRWICKPCIVLFSLVLLFAHFPRPYLAEGTWSILAGALLAYLVPLHKHPVRRMLSWHPLVFVGLFSYSIYLLHSLFLTLGYAIMRSHDGHFGDYPSVQHTLTSIGSALLSLPVAYVFYLYCERPFISSKRQATESRIAS